MVGRGGGKKICNRSIAPGKLMSRVQASRTQLFSKNDQGKLEWLDTWSKEIHVCTTTHYNYIFVTLV